MTITTDSTLADGEITQRAQFAQFARRLTLRHAAMLGFLVGLRSLFPVASLVTAAHARYGNLDAALPSFLNTDLLVWGTRLMAAGELGADKLPILPARTALMPLFGRMGVAATFVTAIARQNERPSSSSPLLPLVAAAGAFVGSHVGYQVRKRLTDKGKLPDVVVALAEDAFVTMGSAFLARDLIGAAGTPEE